MSSSVGMIKNLPPIKRVMGYDGKRLTHSNGSLHTTLAEETQDKESPQSIRLLYDRMTNKHNVVEFLSRSSQKH